MKLRWKYFLVLVTVSLVPLLTVAWISQNASRRLGKTISGRAKNTLIDTVKQEMVRATRSYAAFSFRRGETTKLALKVLAAKAELAVILPPPSLTRIFYAADFDDPLSAPEDMAPSANHPIRSEDGVKTYRPISHKHPNFLLAPGTIKKDVASDIARFTRLNSTLRNLKQHYGEGLIWLYACLANGVYISYPGHGGYPTGYDPRKRPWYKMAIKSKSPTWTPVLDATTGQPDASSKLCLSCHDGTVAVDNFGDQTGGTHFLSGNSSIGTNLNDDHPISFTYDASLVSSDDGLYDPTTTNSGLGGTIAQDMLIGGQVQCASCHDVHNSIGVEKLLRKTNAASALCLTCHNK